MKEILTSTILSATVCAVAVAGNGDMKANGECEGRCMAVGVEDSTLLQSAKTSVHPSLVIERDAIGEMLRNLQFKEADSALGKNIDAAKRKRQSTEELENRRKKCEQGMQYLKGTDKVLIVDSMVVNKERFLSAYRFSPELGRIKLSADGETTIYETERGTKQYGATRVQEDSVSRLQLVSYIKEEDGFSVPEKLDGIDFDCDVNYPFMTTDGVTLYFAARAENGLGNYDLYVTRYDSDGDRFYRPENMGFPYNSYANDYMMVIDESRNIGWFASDRYQPDGKVCIYTFIPNKSRRAFDYENDDSNEIITAASLRSVKSMWNDENRQERIEVKQKISLAMTTNALFSVHDFDFMINDIYTYTTLDDFRSAEARKECEAWMKYQKELEEKSSELEGLRAVYADANSQKRNEMRTRILDLESRVEELAHKVRKSEKNARNIELRASGKI
ncbi:MAG: hypothetical protein NC252_08270 [Roseburia sp.]|nr:hypothetical protein [Roseburia sp.]MCM1420508.1 hypothetical protein [Bacteroides sp.]